MLKGREAGGRPEGPEQALTEPKKPNLRAGRASGEYSPGNVKASPGVLGQSPASSCLSVWDALQRQLPFEESLLWFEVL